jgi:pyruvate/2-oxoglutarate dehydrogenase complex dihydrolipoamide acyltransferase (E2) component
MHTVTEIARVVSAEEEELTGKRRELEMLLSELVERELSLADLKAELADFEGQYLREVCVLYAELDEWNAKIAELIAETDGTSEARSAATEARKQADETYAAAHGEAAKVANFTSSPEIKKLWREVMLSIHPDHAEGEADRILRDRLSKEANNAYSRGDAETLQKILDEYRSSPESVKGGGGKAAELERIVRQIKQVRKKIAQIGLEIAELNASDMAKLVAKNEQLQSQGHSLLAEMAADTKRRINLARYRFEVMAEGRRTA